MTTTTMAAVQSTDLPQLLQITVPGRFITAFDNRKYTRDPDPACRDLATALAAVPDRGTSHGFYRIAALTYDQAGILWELADTERADNNPPGATQDQRSTAGACAKVLTRLNEAGIISPDAEGRLTATNRLTPWRCLVRNDGAGLGRVYTPRATDALHHAFRATGATASFAVRYNDLTPAERAHYHRDGAPTETV